LDLSLTKVRKGPDDVVRPISLIIEDHEVESPCDMIAKVTADLIYKVKEVIALKIRGCESIRAKLTLIAIE
jgi:hypothetical protein